MMGNHIKALGFRSRGVKPALFSCDILGQLPEPVFLLYLSIPCIADRHGVFFWNPLKIWAQLSPYRRNLEPEEIESRLEQLVSAGKVVKYSVGGQLFGYIRDFHLEQKPHHTEKASGLQLPPGYEVPKALMRLTREGSPTCNGDGTVITSADKDTDTDTDTDKDSNHEPSKQQEGKKAQKETAKASFKEKAGNKNNWGIKIPLNDGTFFVPSQNDIECYQEGFPRVDVPAELLKMVDFKTNNPGRQVAPGQQKRSIYATLKAQADFLAGNYRD